MSSEDERTSPHHVIPQSVELLKWEPIQGAPEWANEMDRRNHAERRLLFTDNALLRGEVKALKRDVTDHLRTHDEQIERLQDRVAFLEVENRELRKKLLDVHG